MTSGNQTRRVPLNFHSKRDTTHIEIMDEWPHRKQLLRTFRKHLPGFDAAAAKTGFKARREGRWLCSRAATHLGREPARSKISHAERSGAQSVEA